MRSRIAKPFHMYRSSFIHEQGASIHNVILYRTRATSSLVYYCQTIAACCDTDSKHARLEHSAHGHMRVVNILHNPRHRGVRGTRRKHPRLAEKANAIRTRKRTCNPQPKLANRTDTLVTLQKFISYCSRKEEISTFDKSLMPLNGKLFKWN